MEEVLSDTLFTVFGIPIQDIVVHTWIVMAVLISLAWIAGRNLRVRPRPWQHVLEMFTDYISGLIAQRSKREIPGLFKLAATMMLFIVVANLLGIIPGLKAPTRSLSTTLALSFCSLVAVHYFGVQSQGAGNYFKSFIEPVGVAFIVLPLNLIGEVSRLASMALRLFGNIMAGEIIVAVMYRLVPLVAPIPFVLLSSLTGVLQALVFTFLTIVFIIDAAGEPEEVDEADPLGSAA
jgi:F-type H+-transporting ATPase subunit a